MKSREDFEKQYRIVTNGIVWKIQRNFAPESKAPDWGDALVVCYRSEKEAREEMKCLVERDVSTQGPWKEVE